MVRCRVTDDIILEPANLEWPRLFEEEKTRLLTVSGSHFIAIEHTGSTAVPGLDAKPVIDMLGGVASMAVADALLEPLCAVGWDTSPEFNATLSDRRFLLRWPEGVRTHHLHLVVYGGGPWQSILGFRNRLRAYPELAERYRKLKVDLAAAHKTDRFAYTEAKTAFIADALERYN